MTRLKEFLISRNFPGTAANRISRDGELFDPDSINNRAPPFSQFRRGNGYFMAVLHQSFRDLPDHFLRSAGARFVKLDRVQNLHVNARTFATMYCFAAMTNSRY